VHAGHVAHAESRHLLLGASPKYNLLKVLWSRLTAVTIDLDMDATAPPHGLPHAPLEIVTMVLQTMCVKDRFTSALVCKAWHEAATAATRSIILEHAVQDLSCLQGWLVKHGNQLEVLELHKCSGAVLTALPCPQLQGLLLSGSLSLDSRVWSDIAAATKLTSVSLADHMYTAAKQAEVVSAIAALPDLQQLTWHWVACGSQHALSDGMLLQRLTHLTALELDIASAAALEHLGTLTRLQSLSVDATADWAAAGCHGLQELKALTRLELLRGFNDVPASMSQLTALQQLEIPVTTPTALNQLRVLTGLTQLRLAVLSSGLSPEAPALQLPGLKHLQLSGWNRQLPMSYLASCTQLHVLELYGLNLAAPGSLAASTVLQHLELQGCRIDAAAGAADLAPWQQVFLSPGRLPHLTSLQLSGVQPHLQQEDLACVVACCSSLQVLHLDTLPRNFASTLTCLPGLTSLCLIEGL